MRAFEAMYLHESPVVFVVEAMYLQKLSWWPWLRFKARFCRSTPQDGMSLDDVLVWMMFDIQQHEYWLSHPNPVTGDSKWHQDWVDALDDCIDYLDKDPVTLAILSKDYVIGKMQEAKEIHEYYLTVPENPVLGRYPWHRQWIIVYQETLEYLDKLP